MNLSANVHCKNIFSLLTLLQIAMVFRILNIVPTRGGGGAQWGISLIFVQHSLTPRTAFRKAFFEIVWRHFYLVSYTFHNQKQSRSKYLDSLKNFLCSEKKYNFYLFLELFSCDRPGQNLISTLECAAPKRWSKFTTKNIAAIFKESVHTFLIDINL